MAKSIVTNPKPFVFDSHRGLSPLEQLQDTLEKVHALALMETIEPERCSQHLTYQYRSLLTELIAFALRLLEEHLQPRSPTVEYNLAERIRANTG